MLLLASAPLVIPPSSLSLHVSGSHRPPNAAVRVRCNDGKQIATLARLSEYDPPKFADSPTTTAHDPRGVAVFVHDLFDFLRFDAVPCTVLDVVVIPLRLQLLEPHAGKLPRSKRTG